MIILSDDASVRRKIRDLEHFYTQLLSGQPNFKTMRDELRIYVVLLDKDPTSQRLGALNAKIAEVLAYRSRVATMAGEAEARVHLWKRLVHEIEELVEVEMERHMLMDPFVSNQPNAAQRKAAANLRISVTLRELGPKAERELGFAQTFLKIVDHKLTDLDRTYEGISRQVTIVGMQMTVSPVSVPQPQPPGPAPVGVTLSPSFAPAA